MPELSPTVIDFRIAEASDIPHADEIKKLLFPNDPHTYAENILYPTTRNVVATLSGGVIGYASALTVGQNPRGAALWQRIRPYIGFIGIHPEYQRKGIGSQLLRVVCLYIFETTSEQCVYLECEQSLVPFYTKSGFTEMTSTEVETLFGRNPTSSSVCYICRNGAIS